MNYSPRPGIVRAKICGEYLLIPTRSASEECPEVMRLSLMGAALWEELEKGRELKKLYEVFAILSRKPEEEIRERTDKLLDRLYEKGYLVEAPSGEAGG